MGRGKVGQGGGGGGDTKARMPLEGLEAHGMEALWRSRSKQPASRLADAAADRLAQDSGLGTSPSVLPASAWAANAAEVEAEAMGLVTR